VSIGNATSTLASCRHADAHRTTGQGGEELTGIFMTQLMLASAYPLGRELRVLTYASLID
jgi:hypothetical protein